MLGSGVQGNVGIWPGVSRVEYDSIEAINVSRLQHFEKSDLHGRDAMLHPKSPSRSMEVGTIFHMNMLEPGRFEAEYVVPPKLDRRYKDQKLAWDEFEAANVGKSYVDAEGHDQIIGMRNMIWSRPFASGVLSAPGLNEVAIVWQDEDTGILCKGLLDKLAEYAGWTWLADIKSTRDASHEGFSREIKKHSYGAKAAFYHDGCNVLAPRERRFVWLAVENSRPYAAAEHECTEEAIEKGRSHYRRWLRRYAEALRTGQWLGYPEEVQPMFASDTEWRVSE